MQSAAKKVLNKHLVQIWSKYATSRARVLPPASCVDRVMASSVVDTEKPFSVCPGIYCLMVYDFNAICAALQKGELYNASQERYYRPCKPNSTIPL